MGSEVTAKGAEGDPLPPYKLEDAFKLSRLQGTTVVKSLSVWQQGDIIAGLPLAWVAQDGTDPLFYEDESIENTTGEIDGAQAVEALHVLDDGAVAESSESLQEVKDPQLAHWVYEPEEVKDDEDLPILISPKKYSYGIITSQTCDIAATGPGQRHPVVQVSPLVPIDSLGDRADNVRRGEVVDMVVVPNVKPANTWAADLRISIPVSKGVLLEQVRRSGFKDEEGLLSFAEAVALKYWRPAIHDAVEGLLVKSLDKFVGAARGRGDHWVDDVFQFRLMVNRGSRLHPSEVTILVLTRGSEFEPVRRDPLRKWRTNFRKTFSDACDGADLCPLIFERIEQIPLMDYRNSVPLRISGLGRSLGFTLG